MSQYVDENRVKAMVEARRSADEFLTMILEESHAIAAKHCTAAASAFLMHLRDMLTEILPKAPEPEPEPVEEAAWESAVRLCDEIVCDCAEVPEEGGAFAQSVTQTTEAIRSTIMSTRRVTLAQSEALQNMHAGVLRWLGSMD